MGKNFECVKECAYCGREFKLSYPNQKYCCDEHSKFAAQDQRKEYMREYRKRYTYTDKNGVKHRLYPCSVKGSKGAKLGPHRVDDFEKEQKLINKELKRVLNIKR